MSGDMGPPEACITCGDIAVELVVVEISGDTAMCEASDGGREAVAIDLVAPVRVGDRLLVHARVALTRVE